jgi:hypothetical protein
MTYVRVLEPRATAGDHLSPAQPSPTVIAVAAAATYPRLSAGLETQVMSQGNPWFPYGTPPSLFF